MEITEKKAGNVIVMSLAGRIDSFTAEKLDEELNAKIKTGKQKFVINFNEVNYISSAGLKVFLGAYKKLSPTNGKIKFSNMADSVLKVFALAGFDKFFEIYTTENEALKDFNKEKEEEEPQETHEPKHKTSKGF